MTQKEEKYDYHLLLTFLWQFHAFEEQLKAAGFRKIDKPDEADWLSFVGMVRAGEIEVKPLDPRLDDDVVDDAMLHLMYQPLQGKSKNKYILHDTTLVAEVLQERGRQFMSHTGVKAFTDEDFEMMVTGLVVMPFWSAAVEGWMKRGKSV